MNKAEIRIVRASLAKAQFRQYFLSVGKEKIVAEENREDFTNTVSANGLTEIGGGNQQKRGLL